MKSSHKILLSFTLGFAALVGGAMTVRPVKHFKGKDGYVIPTDGTQIESSKLEPDHMANFIAELPLYIGLIIFVILDGYAVITMLKNLRDHRLKAQEEQSNR